MERKKEQVNLMILVLLFSDGFLVVSASAAVAVAVAVAVGAVIVATTTTVNLAFSTGREKVMVKL